MSEPYEAPNGLTLLCCRRQGVHLYQSPETKMVMTARQQVVAYQGTMVCGLLPWEIAWSPQRRVVPRRLVCRECLKAVERA